MRNIFTKQNNNETLKIELFDNWEEMKKEDLKKKIKKQKTEDLKEILKSIGIGTTLGIGVVLIEAIIIELATRE